MKISSLLLKEMSCSKRFEDFDEMEEEEWERVFCLPNEIKMKNDEVFSLCFVLSKIFEDFST